MNEETLPTGGLSRQKKRKQKKTKQLIHPLNSFIFLYRFSSFQDDRKLKAKFSALEMSVTYLWIVALTGGGGFWTERTCVEFVLP